MICIKIQVNRLTDFLAVHSRFLAALRRLFLLTKQIPLTSLPKGKPYPKTSFNQNWSQYYILLQYPHLQNPPRPHPPNQTVDFFLIFHNMLGAVKMKRTSTYFLYDLFPFQISISLCRETGHKYRIWGVCKGVLKFTRTQRHEKWQYTYSREQSSKFSLFLIEWPSSLRKQRTTSVEVRRWIAAGRRTTESEESMASVLFISFSLSTMVGKGQKYLG